MNKLKCGDQVVVVTGSAKGSVGEILKFQGKDRVLVKGVNLRTKHIKPKPQLGVEGGRVAKELSLHVSNVALQNPQTSKADRVGFKKLNDGTWVRFFKSNQEQVAN